MLAALCAGLVLLLAASSQSPVFHAWLHEHEAVLDGACSHKDLAHENGHPTDDVSDADHGCAVTLFAHGVTAADTALPTLLYLDGVRTADAVARDLIAPERPHRLFPPTQAPPAGC